MEAAAENREESRQQARDSASWVWRMGRITWNGTTEPVSRVVIGKQINIPRVQLPSTIRIGNLTRLIHIVLYGIIMWHVYIHVESNDVVLVVVVADEYTQIRNLSTQANQNLEQYGSCRQRPSSSLE